jgi:hypothetical protein
MRTPAKTILSQMYPQTLQLKTTLLIVGKDIIFLRPARPSKYARAGFVRVNWKKSTFLCEAVFRD